MTGKKLWPAVAVIGMFAASSQTDAGFWRHCWSCPPPCVRYECVEKTVMVPHTEFEERTITCVEYRPEQREKTVTVYRQVPVTKQVTKTCTIMVPEKRVRQEEFTVCKPVWETATRNYTVMVPHQVERSGTRRVCKYETVTETRTVCEDQGCFQCDGCGCKVWVPKIVKREVPVQVCRPTYVDEPYTYVETVCKPEQRSCDVKVCRYEYEKRGARRPLHGFASLNKSSGPIT